MDRIRRDSLLGLVFFGTLAFLLWATVNLTDMSLGKVPPLEVYFEDGGGIEVGANVLVLGKKVGKVGAIDILYERPQNQARLTLLVEEAIPLTDRMRIEIQDAGLLGTKQVYIDPGRGGPWPADREKLGATTKNVMERIGEIADGKGELGKNLNGTLTAIRSLFESLRDEQNTIGRLTTRRELYDEILQTVQRLNGIFEVIQTGKSTLGRLAVDTAMGERFQHILDNLAATSDALVGKEGTIGMLLNDAGAAQNLRSILADIATLTTDTKDGKGALGKILTDETMARDLTEALANLSAVLKKANDPEAGTLGRLLGDADLGKDLTAILANLRTVSERLIGTDTLLGILISDKDVGVRFRSIIKQVSRALEDAREAAPIGSFVQVLLGAF
ncbi:MAG: MCE family protein [Planctomycetes bacterium]|jgi:phospholipid/cholesterol/gamma-HCH transport system substrate-binding protein|nr:MCE family protein [Planctomycetota bacterium]